jgi:hypothetical protein
VQRQDQAVNANPISLANGTNIRRPRGGRGLGTLTISNYTADDAAVALTTVSLDGRTRTIRYVYVQAKAYVKLTGISPGVYNVLFREGKDWDQSRQAFRMNETFARFENTMPFTEDRMDGRTVQYSAYMLTLHEVPEGNIKKQPISAAEFMTGLGSEDTDQPSVKP